MSHVSAGQEALVSKKRVFCTITTALKRGMCVCYDRDRVTDERGNSYAATVVNTGRFRVVETPDLGNIEDFAGWVAADYGAAPTGEAGRFIEIITPIIGACVPVYAKSACVINSTILGPVPGQTYMVAGAVFSPWAVKAVQTVATLGTTAGEVQAIVIRSDSREAKMSVQALETHFMEQAGVSGWTQTIASGGAVSLIVTEAGGVLQLLNDNTDDDVINLQALAAVVLTASKALHFKARVKLTPTTANQIEAFVGLHATDTDIVAGRANHIGFLKDDNDANIYVTAKVGTETKTDSTVDDDAAYHVYEMIYDGGTLTHYIDGVAHALAAQTYVAALVAAGTMIRPSLELRNGDANISAMTVDYLFVRAAA